MRRAARIWAWIRSIARRDRFERRLNEEIRFHIEEQTEKNRRAGMSPGEARRLALVKFGGLEGITESTRDEIRPALLGDAWRDLRHATRILRRAPGLCARWPGRRDVQSAIGHRQRDRRRGEHSGDLRRAGRVRRACPGQAEER